MEQYTDILEKRLQFGDLCWVLQKWESQPKAPTDKTPLTRKEVKQAVLTSQRVQNVIQDLEKETNTPRAVLEKEARNILEEMAHDLILSGVRMFGYILSKLMRRLYRHIYVSRAGVEKVRKMMGCCPVLFLPSHRSYVDFLSISYLCFYYHLPLPIIAAGMDFQSMTFFGELMRRAGAFFIRRSFVEDQLYWAVFQSYVQLLVMGTQPIEFFLEGTRSRTAKTLPPKLGLLSSLLEPWLTGKIPDVVICPISISYDRTLEETLYAYELLGVPKPKESTSGLLRSRRALSESYGSIYFTFGEPVSVLSLLSPSNLRRSHALGPLCAQKLTNQELKECKSVACTVLHIQQQQAVVPVWSLVSVVLKHGGKPRYDMKSLVECVGILSDAMQALGGNILNGDLEGCVGEALSVHKNLVSLEDGLIGVSQLPRVVSQNVEDQRQDRLAQRLSLQHYVNQSAFHLARPAYILIASTMLRSQTAEEDSLFHCALFLETIFRNEFVYDHQMKVVEFESVCWQLEHLGCMDTSEPSWLCNVICSFLAPYINTYWMITCVLKDMFGEVSLKEVWKVLLERTQDNDDDYLLSLNLLQNAMCSLSNLKALRKQKDKYEVNPIVVRQLMAMLERYVMSAEVKAPSLTSKL